MEAYFTLNVTTYIKNLSPNAKILLNEETLEMFNTWKTTEMPGITTTGGEAELPKRASKEGRGN